MSEIRIYKSKNWPQRLLEIPKPPKKLWIRGQNPNLAIKWLCVVGPRKHSEYGKEVCQKLISDLAKYPVGIISGLAFGIDSMAHQIALENNLPTISFPGSGLNDSSIYPKTHLKLAEEILEKNSCLISEFAPDFQATHWAFPQRNRLMVGFAHAVLVIEAGEKSGTLITANMAIDYNKEILAVPGSIFSSMSIGTNNLIKQGAVPVRNFEDILEVLNIEKNNCSNTLDLEKFNLSALEKKILFSINEKTQTKNELCENLDVSIGDINQIITSLELKGLLVEREGKICQK
ncbi:DNA-protecting protein DprA [Candidatus Nomurabacteria bacterium]|nr:DNA-protecting protein DprA [Candidatus Nomurabacteria bacterium]